MARLMVQYRQWKKGGGEDKRSGCRKARSDVGCSTLVELMKLRSDETVTALVGSGTLR